MFIYCQTSYTSQLFCHVFFIHMMHLALIVQSFWSSCIHTVCATVKCFLWYIPLCTDTLPLPLHLFLYYLLWLQDLFPFYCIWLTLAFWSDLVALSWERWVSNKVPVKSKVEATYASFREQCSCCKAVISIYICWIYGQRYVNVLGCRYVGGNLCNNLCVLHLLTLCFTLD